MRTDVPAGPHDRGALPNLIVAGYSKCGTSSLHRYLDRHPEIAMSRVKELGYFCHVADRGAIEALPPTDRSLVHARTGNWSKGVDWYRTHFDPAAPIRGESTPGYTIAWYPDAPARIRRTLGPDVKLVLCVRDPVERALSRQRFARVRGIDSRTGIDEITDPAGYHHAAALYSPAWERLVRTFGDRLDVHIVETERLGAAPAETMDSLFGFLGLEGGLPDSEFAHRWNETSHFASPASRLLVRLRRLRGWGYVAEALPVRWRDRWERLLGAGRGREPVDERLRERWMELLAPEAERFRSLTGRSFSGWSV